MSERVEFEVCIGCGHHISKHYNDVTGKARCLVVVRGVSDRGVIGLPWEHDCQCCDFQLPKKEAPKP